MKQITEQQYVLGLAWTSFCFFVSGFFLRGVFDILRKRRR